MVWFPFDFVLKFWRKSSKFNQLIKSPNQSHSDTAYLRIDWISIQKYPGVGNKWTIFSPHFVVEFFRCTEFNLPKVESLHPVAFDRVSIGFFWRIHNLNLLISLKRPSIFKMNSNLFCTVCWIWFAMGSDGGGRGGIRGWVRGQVVHFNDYCYFYYTDFMNI